MPSGCLGKQPRPPSHDTALNHRAEDGGDKQSGHEQEERSQQGAVRECSFSVAEPEVVEQEHDLIMQNITGIAKPPQPATYASGPPATAQTKMMSADYEEY